MRLEPVTFDDVRRALHKIEEGAKKDNTYTIVFHPSIITYDRKKVRTWKDFERRHKRNMLVYNARKMFGYDTTQIFIH